jgi:hypothetical protein
VPDVFGGRASGADAVPPTLVTNIKEMGLWITNLEGLQDGDAITVGIRTFRSSKDCKTFLLQEECPGGILNTYNYDMVALLHRIKREGVKLTSTEQVQHDSAVWKGAFPSLASQMIHNLYESSLPAPLSVVGSAGVQAQHLVPAVETYATWNAMDRMTGLGPELAAEVETVSTLVNSLIMNDCRGHLGAANFFEILLLKAGTQFASLRSFVTTNHAQSLTVSGDKEEAHWSIIEVFKGVFKEVHKIRCKAVDQNGLDHTIRDAGRSLWTVWEYPSLDNDGYGWVTTLVCIELCAID